MTVDRYLRLIAGSIITVSIALAYFVHPAWMFLTLFVAVNLIQSAFTKWCPMMTFLRKLGVRDVSSADARKV